MLIIMICRNSIPNFKRKNTTSDIIFCYARIVLVGLRNSAPLHTVWIALEWRVVVPRDPACAIFEEGAVALRIIFVPRRAPSIDRFRQWEAVILVGPTRGTTRRVDPPRDPPLLVVTVKCDAGRTASVVDGLDTVARIVVQRRPTAALVHHRDQPPRDGVVLHRG